MDDTNSAACVAARFFDSSSPQVRAADHVTRYTRVGAGRPVVVLDELACNPTLWPTLLDRLADRHRVILPEVPAGDSRFHAWLRGFVDGMGLSALTLVAAGALCIPALEFALLEVERVNRLLLVPSGSVDETAQTGSLTSSLGSARVPILVIRRESPINEAFPAIEQFFRDETS